MEREDNTQLDNYLQNTQHHMDNMQISANDGCGVGGGGVGIGIIDGGDNATVEQFVAGIGGGISNVGGKFDEQDDVEEWKIIKEGQQSEKEMKNQETGGNIGDNFDDDDFLVSHNDDGGAGSIAVGNGFNSGKNHFNEDFYNNDIAGGNSLVDDEVEIIKNDGDISTTSNTTSTAGEDDLLLQQPEMKMDSNIVIQFEEQKQKSDDLFLQENIEHLDEEENDLNSLATTTNGTSSLSENAGGVPQPQQKQQQQLETLDVFEGEEEEEKDIGGGNLNLHGFNLNPNAQEFVPSFGSNATTPTSPLPSGDCGFIPDKNNAFDNMGDINVNAPDKNLTSENPVPDTLISDGHGHGGHGHGDGDGDVEHLSAVPRHLIEDDDFVALSPRKGRVPDMDRMPLPKEEEFENEVAKRPHELEQEDDIPLEQLEITNNCSSVLNNDEFFIAGNSSSDQHNLSLNDSFVNEQDCLDYQRSSPNNYMDHGPETCVDQENDLSSVPELSNDIKQTLFMENPIEDVLNSVQPLPIDNESANTSFIDQENNSNDHDLISKEINHEIDLANKELFNVEEKEHISQSPSTEEFDLNIKNHQYEELLDLVNQQQQQEFLPYDDQPHDLQQQVSPRELLQEEPLQFTQQEVMQEGVNDEKVLEKVSQDPSQELLQELPPEVPQEISEQVQPKEILQFKQGLEQDILQEYSLEYQQELPQSTQDFPQGLEQQLTHDIPQELSKELPKENIQELEQGIEQEILQEHSQKHLLDFHQEQNQDTDEQESKTTLAFNQTQQLPLDMKESFYLENTSSDNFVNENEKINDDIKLPSEEAFEAYVQSQQETAGGFEDSPLEENFNRQNDFHIIEGNIEGVSIPTNENDFIPSEDNNIFNRENIEKFAEEKHLMEDTKESHSSYLSEQIETDLNAVSADSFQKLEQQFENLTLANNSSIILNQDEEVTNEPSVDTVFKANDDDYNFLMQKDEPKNLVTDIQNQEQDFYNDETTNIIQHDEQENISPIIEEAIIEKEAIIPVEEKIPEPKLLVESMQIDDQSSVHDKEVTLSIHDEAMKVDEALPKEEIKVENLISNDEIPEVKLTNEAEENLSSATGATVAATAAVAIVAAAAATAAAVSGVAKDKEKSDIASARKSISNKSTTTTTSAAAKPKVGASATCGAKKSVDAAKKHNLSIGASKPATSSLAAKPKSSAAATKPSPTSGIEKKTGPTNLVGKSAATTTTSAAKLKSLPSASKLASKPTTRPTTTAAPTAAASKSATSNRSQSATKPASVPSATRKPAANTSHLTAKPRTVGHNTSSTVATAKPSTLTFNAGATAAAKPKTPSPRSTLTSTTRKAPVPIGAARSPIKHMGTTTSTNVFHSKTSGSSASTTTTTTASRQTKSTGGAISNITTTTTTSTTKTFTARPAPKFNHSSNTLANRKATVPTTTTTNAGSTSNTLKTNTTSSALRKTSPNKSLTSKNASSPMAKSAAIPSKSLNVTKAKTKEANAKSPIIKPKQKETTLTNGDTKVKDPKDPKTIDMIPHVNGSGAEALANNGSVVTDEKVLENGFNQLDKQQQQEQQEQPQQQSNNDIPLIGM